MGGAGNIFVRMAILKIARMGHPVLMRPASPVTDPTSPGIRALVDDMVETMADARGLGLAAPQVHVPLRVVVFRVPEGGSNATRPESARRALTVLINPEVTPIGQAMETGWEGCLSVPGLRGLVPRHAAIRYAGLTPDGTRIECEAEGYHARVVQHECDHLDGVLYPMRMADLSKLVFESEFHRYAVSPVAETNPDDDGEGFDDE